MPLSRLTTREIEHRIDQFNERIKSLKDVLKDVKDMNAKSTLKDHIDQYNENIKELRAELSRRNKLLER